ncbi:MAG: pilus assembly protein [Alphaproteobacteria bacterium]|nr:pilus assembly protein [Alphaproteobacteria bacterium]
MRLTLRRFLTDERGVTAVIFVLTVAVMVGGAGMSIDAAQNFRLKQQLQRATDSAALTIGRRTLEEESSFAELVEDGCRFVRLNMREGYTVTCVESSTPDPAASDEISVAVNFSSVDVFRVSAQTAREGVLVAILAPATFPIKANAGTEADIQQLEVAMVLDITGSMRTQGKIEALQDASIALVESLQSDGIPESVRPWISIVPYVAGVNVGLQYDGWLSASDPTDQNVTRWSGCVEQRFDAELDASEAPPGDADGGFRPYRRFNEDFSLIRCAGADVSPDGAVLSEGQPIVPLTQDREGLVDYLVDLETSRGGTMTAIGAVWGWRTLSPFWSGVWDGVPTEKPAIYGREDLTKALVIMTDGQSWIPSYSGYGEVDTSAFPRTSEGLGPFTSGPAVIDAKLLDVCSNAKAQGVQVFTIAFRMPERLHGVYCACSTQEDVSPPGECLDNTDPEQQYFFPAPTNQSLVTSFERIGARLQNVQLID